MTKLYLLDLLLFVSHVSRKIYENSKKFKEKVSGSLCLVDAVVCYLVALTSQLPGELAAERSHLRPFP